ncbi:MAG: MmcQ/YjbR family DNA-binding protein [Thermomicrobiales bacterium]
MVDEAGLRAIAMALPGTVANDLTFEVNGRGFAWPWRERVHPKKPKVPRRDILVVMTADLDDKEALLAGEPESCFTEDHYNGYPAVLVRLDAIEPDRLAELLEDAHAAAIAKGPPKPRKGRAGKA